MVWELSCNHSFCQHYELVKHTHNKIKQKHSFIKVNICKQRNILATGPGRKYVLV